jgi:hypothetical protein
MIVQTVRVHRAWMVLTLMLSVFAFLARAARLVDWSLPVLLSPILLTIGLFGVLVYVMALVGVFGGLR